MDTDTAKILHEAIKHNTVWLVKKLVEERQCCELVDELGRLPLHVAVLDNRWRIVSILVKNGANVNSRSRIGRTPLHEAACRGYREIVDILLDNGAAINARTYHQWTALILAAAEGHPKVVQRLLDGGADVEARTSEEKPQNGRLGMSALSAAAILLDPEVAHLLLRYGADPNTTMKNGDTALQRAVTKQCSVTAFLLYCYGALAQAGNSASADTPLDQMKKLPPEQGRKLKYLAKDNQSTAITISRPGKLGPGPDMRNLNVSKAMHLAVSASSPVVVEYLIKTYAEALEILGPRNWHPLHRAARDNALESVVVLLKNGAEVDSRTRNGWTALLLAAENGHDDVIRTLIKYQADPAAKTGRGKTGIYVAENEKHFSTASLLKMEMHKTSFKHVDPNDITPILPKSKMLSPGPSREVPSRPSSTDPESEFDEDEDEEGFAFFDAKDASLQTDLPDSTSPLGNSTFVEQYLRTLETTWYNKIPWSPQDDLEDSKHSSKPGPIKIAVLDTGIDLQHEDFKRPARRRTKHGQNATKAMPEKAQRDRIAGFKNFSDASHPDDNIADDDGHGTHVAGIILGIAPRAELYIAKIFSGRPQDTVTGTAKATVPKWKRAIYDSIEAALIWSIEQKVDIINMSFGFDHISQASPSSDALQDALRKANEANIIVLAAAANHANRDDIAWPARDGESAICVTSGDDGLNKSRFAPGSNSRVDAFITHGEGVLSHQAGGGFRKMSGTSVATPVAVGVVAMILALLKVTREWSAERKRRELITRAQEMRVRSTRGMARVLRSASRESDGFFVLQPQLLWAARSKTAEQAVYDIAKEIGDI